MEPPFFSVIIPTYNRAKHIENTIQSVINQNFIDFEVLIIDDGSTDDSEIIIKKLISENEKINIKYFHKENRERAKARNFGVKHATGQYITFLDSDDLMYPNHLEEAKKLIENNPEAVFLHLAYQITTEKMVLFKQDKRKGNLNQQLLTGNHLSCIGVFVKAEVMQKNLFNEDINLSGTEDYELWMRLASKYPIFYNNIISASIIQHNSRSVVNTNEEKLVKRIQLCIDYLNENQDFRQYYGKQKNVMEAHLWLYVALHLVLENHWKIKKQGLYYLKKAIRKYWKVIFTKKMGAILKKVIF
jgi:glycosyltransferase involved in cell wall biosynthesis